MRAVVLPGTDPVPGWVEVTTPHGRFRYAAGGGAVHERRGRAPALARYLAWLGFPARRDLALRQVCGLLFDFGELDLGWVRWVPRDPPADDRALAPPDGPPPVLARAGDAVTVTFERDRAAAPSVGVALDSAGRRPGPKPSPGPGLARPRRERAILTFRPDGGWTIAHVECPHPGDPWRPTQGGWAP